MYSSTPYNTSCISTRYYHPMCYYYKQKILDESLTWRKVAEIFGINHLKLYNNMEAIKRRWLKKASPINPDSANLQFWPKKVAKGYLSWLGLSPEEQTQFLKLRIVSKKIKRKQTNNIGDLAKICSDVFSNYEKYQTSKRKRNHLSYTTYYLPQSGPLYSQKIDLPVPERMALARQLKLYNPDFQKKAFIKFIQLQKTQFDTIIDCNLQVESIYSFEVLVDFVLDEPESFLMFDSETKSAFKTLLYQFTKCNLDRVNGSFLRKVIRLMELYKL